VTSLGSLLQSLSAATAKRTVADGKTQVTPVVNDRNVQFNFTDKTYNGAHQRSALLQSKTPDKTTKLLAKQINLDNSRAANEPVTAARIGYGKYVTQLYI